MPNGWVENVVAETRVAGATAQIVASHYDAGDMVSQTGSQIMVRWRMWPGRVNICAWHDDREPINVGQMMLYPPGVQIDAVAHVPADMRSLALLLDPEWLSESLEIKYDPLSWQSWIAPDFRNLNIEQSLRRISSDVMAPGPYSRVLLEGCSMSIAVDLARCFRVETGLVAETRDILSARRIRRVEEYILNYSGGSPTITEIAADLGIGAGYLRQIFKETTGKTLFKFVDEVRIARAQALMADSNLPLKVVAHELGYCSPSAFSLAFRKATGVTPREYRLLQK